MVMMWVMGAGVVVPLKGQLEEVLLECRDVTDLYNSYAQPNEVRRCFPLMVNFKLWQCMCNTCPQEAACCRVLLIASHILLWTPTKHHAALPACLSQMWDVCLEICDFAGQVPANYVAQLWDLTLKQAWEEGRERGGAAVGLEEACNRM